MSNAKSWVKKHPVLARLVLYLVPASLVVSMWWVSETVRPSGTGWDWEKVDYSQFESVELLREYLRIDTSYPDGDELRGAEMLARELEKVGLVPQIERLGSRNANLWAILEGDSPKALVLHNHLDVDPVAFPDRWLHPPFGGELAPPYIIGRGAFDMKSIAIAQLMAIQEIARSGQRPEQSLIFLATGDEERDSQLGVRWLLRQHPDLVERFGGALTEGGAVETIDLDRVKYWGTEHLQKRFIEIRVCHSNQGVLKALREDLLSRVSVDDVQGRPRLSADTTAFLKSYGTTRERDLFQRLLADPEALLDDPGAFELLPRNAQSMMRNEIVAWPITEGPDGGWILRIILHLLPWTTLEEGMEELLPGGLPGYAMSLDVPHGIIGASSLDEPLFRGIDQFMAKALPDVAHGGLFVPWSATDARFFRAAGIPAYGFSPFLMVTSDTAKMSGPNERIAAPAFVDGVELYIDLIRHLVLPRSN